MILTIFLVLLGLAVLCIGLGFALGENYFKFVGLFFLFLLGVQLMSGSVEYETGMVTNTTINFRESYIYGDNYSVYHWDYASTPPSCTPNNLDCVNLFHVNRTTTEGVLQEKQYVAFDQSSAFWYGFLLSLLGGFGMVVMLFQTHNDFKASKEALK